ncbi:MAG: tRNA specific adenosine deaminase [Bacillota bacterium]|nr:MAG: tRNA specific adenosine deaminase [Bacillota bacterium]MBS3950344.1 tRNA adenosine(34) deaminase TadA [Peptococcaceae bacterium]
MEHEHFMLEALAEARAAAEIDETPVGAVMVREGKIIARGHNLRELCNDPTAHSEMIVIREASRVLGGWRLTDCTLYVTLEPCIMCAGTMVLARLPKLVFGAFDPRAGAAGSVIDVLTTNNFNHKVEVVGGVLAHESGMLLKEFFKDLRQRK